MAFEWSSMSDKMVISCTPFSCINIHNIKSIRFTKVKKMVKILVFGCGDHSNRYLLRHSNDSLWVNRWPNHLNHLDQSKYAISSQFDAPTQENGQSPLIFGYLDHSKVFSWFSNDPAWAILHPTCRHHLV